MTTEHIEAESLLVVDVGSRSTRAMLFDVVDGLECSLAFRSKLFDKVLALVWLQVRDRWRTLVRRGSKAVVKVRVVLGQHRE